MSAIHLTYPTKQQAQDMADRLQNYLATVEGYTATGFVKPIKHALNNEWRLTINQEKITDYQDGIIANVLTPEEEANVLTEIDKGWFNYTDI